MTPPRRNYGRITDKVREQAVESARKLQEAAHMGRTAACAAVADQLNVSTTSVLNWYAQAYPDADADTVDVTELRKQIAMYEEQLRMSRELNQSLLEMNTDSGREYR
ncbi:hypothetical protein [Nocardia asteroides]|uniref:hypothetical protein n=1 Tax=Nocardia asteroides TaxID=1824 RepID=UPI001E65AB5B|nr:hypothetical protein [Nocardia asteroides]UGT58894.1 hypothetical protein LTT85_32930 [Nocardia asteroides]